MGTLHGDVYDSSLYLPENEKYFIEKYREN